MSEPIELDDPDEDDGEPSPEEERLRDERLRDAHINRLIDRAREERGGRR